ncbi:MAG TPA: hypothetical protein VGQ45_03810 [Gaiellales bacterium]|jgi:hypothetical protein|nr:hypothetical protein [Gaiellales bacterium]
MTSAVVAVIPDVAGAGHRPLLAALEQAYPVRFVPGGGDGLAAAEAVLVLPGGRLPERLAVPSLVLEGEQAAGASPFQVRIHEHDRLARALRGQRLVERMAPPPRPLVPVTGQEVLAEVGGAPVWLRSEDGGVARETAATALHALEPGEFLRDHLSVGRFWSLLPIVHFVQGICGRPAQPPLRACFVIDDPNIRFSSYGSVRYGELAADAGAHGYHVSFATIPLDLTLPGHRAAALFREHPRRLSLAVHGNDHLRLELERARSHGDADRLVATAIARVERFERRAGLRIERVMCPPHGGCSPATLRSLFAHGFLGLAASRPFPWNGFGEHCQWPAAGWMPAQLIGGLPVLPRYSLANDLDDLVFRALLRQPLIIYCHQADLRRGLDPFREAVARTARLGEVEWTSLAEIARRNVSVHESDELATVTVYSRDARVRRPRAPRLRIEVPRMFAPGQAPTVWVDGVAHDVELLPDGRRVVTIENDHGGELLRVRLTAADGTTRADVAAARPGAWPLARRAMTESRDRIARAIR